MAPINIQIISGKSTAEILKEIGRNTDFAITRIESLIYKYIMLILEKSVSIEDAMLELHKDLVSLM